MILETVPLEIVGLKTDLPVTVRTLQRLGCVQVDELDPALGVSARPLTLDREALRDQEELKSLAARVDGLLDTLDGKGHRTLDYQPVDPVAEARIGVPELTAKLQSLISRRDALQAEMDALPRYQATLRRLLPITPPSAYEPGMVSVGVMVSRAHLDVLDLISKHVLEQTDGRADVMAGDVDETTRAMLLTFPSEFTGEIEALLGREDVSRLRLPTELGQGPPDAALVVLRRRLVAIPEEIEAIDRQLADLAAQWCPALVVWRAALWDELNSIGVLSHFGETEMTFVLVGWVLGRDVHKVETALEDAVGDAVLIRRLPLSPELQKRAPVILQNPQPARSFESLVRLLSLPRYGDLDPTWSLTLFMPIFCGMMLGDVGYGVLLLGFCLGARRHYKTGVMHDILNVLALGAVWSILFGFLYGEAFGTLGEHLGMHALWFERASPDHVGALLLMTLAVGAVHITLGLVLGVWQSIKVRSQSHLLERGGMLVGLTGLFFVVGVLTDVLPEGFMTPAIGGLVVGIVLLSVPMGWVGILIGPIEFIGLIGNMLSYLRIAAIGLASIYLAQVANDMAGKVGSLIVGIIVVVLIHALNLVMGAFSPTIHSLRLHYVEFFRKFYQGGGRPFEPFGSEIRPDASSQSTH